MRIAISGKGGTGKTTIASALAQKLRQNSHKVLAIDADTNPNLALSLGVSREAAEKIPALSERFLHISQPTTSLPGLIENYSYETPAGIPLLVMGRVNHADEGCLCRAYTLIRDILAKLDHRKQIITVVDMNAGLEYLQRKSVRYIDLMLLVIEPYYRAMEAAARINALAEPLHIKHIYVVANKIRDEKDWRAIQDFCDVHQLTVVAGLPFEEKLVGLPGVNGFHWEAETEALEKLVSQVEADYRAKLLCDMMFSLSEKFLLTTNTELSQREILTVRYLGQYGAMTMSQLAEWLKAAFSTTTAIVDKLAGKNLVERFQNPADRRVIFVKLTERGENFFCDHLAGYENLVKNMLHSLSEVEEKSFITLMKKIAN